MDEAIDFETADPRTIWERIFKSILFNMEEGQPLCWIIDGLDEADNPRALIRLFSDISFIIDTNSNLTRGPKDLGDSRRLSEGPKVLKPSLISIEGHLEDLRCYIHQELSMYGTEYNEGIVQRLVGGAQNNFLVSSAKFCAL